MRVVYQSQKQKRIQPNKESGYANWSEVAQELDSQPELREEFEQYTIHHFAAENYYFVEDVKAFKTFFYQKNDLWRAQKVKSLVHTYITSGGVMELNISHDVRHTILSRAANISSENSLKMFDLFDIATNELERSVLLGLWSQFQRSSRKKN